MHPGNSLAVVQCLGLCASSAGGTGSILVPGHGTEILLAAYCGQKKKKPPKNVYLNCIIAVCIPQLNYHMGRYLDLSCSQLCPLAPKRETGTQ